MRLANPENDRTHGDRYEAVSRDRLQIEMLLDDACDVLFEAVVERTEEAIVNALCMASDMRGQGDHFAPALPLDELTELLQRHHVARQP